MICGGNVNVMCGFRMVVLGSKKYDVNGNFMFCFKFEIIVISVILELVLAVVGMIKNGFSGLVKIFMFENLFRFVLFLEIRILIFLLVLIMDLFFIVIIEL